MSLMENVKAARGRQDLTQTQEMYTMTAHTQKKDRLCSAKQFRAIVYKFAKVVQEQKSIPDMYWFRLWKQVEAVLASNNPKGVTSFQISEWFESDTLPGYLLANLQLDFEGRGKAKTHKANRKVKAAPKPKATKTAPKPKAEPKSKATPKPKATAKSNDLKDLEIRMTFVEGQVSEMSESIETIKSGMESILAHLQG